MMVIALRQLERIVPNAARHHDIVNKNEGGVIDGVRSIESAMDS